MATRHITPLFGGNHGIHVLKKCQLIILFLLHPTLTPYMLDYKETIDCPISSVCILLLSWGPVALAGCNICE